MRVTWSQPEDLIGHERKPVARAVDRLQRQLALTTAGAQERAQGWPAVIVDLLARRYREQLRRLPDPEVARSELAEVVLASAREISAADLAAAIGSTRKQAAAARSAASTPAPSASPRGASLARASASSVARS